ncbi:MAG: hypothetical protein ACJAS4_001290 [Bacteriovoracaceae bacterium]|jgi:hypothetical protein
MKNLLITFIFLVTSSSFSQESKTSDLTQEEREDSVVDYSNIKSVILNDGLQSEKEKKQELVKEIKSQRGRISSNRHNYPSADDYWSMLSELWLVKNAQVLRWDFPKPEYGLNIAFQQLLEKFGYYNKAFKILIVNTPTLTHFSLPDGKNSFIFILSLPFMRSLDLTKVDISLLMFEDFLRMENGFFITNVEIDQKFLGTNFQEKKLDKSQLKNALKKYTDVVFNTGFNFQQQYEVTKAVDQILKSDPALWSAYFKLYKKLDRFIKTDLLYKNYLKIYPSPELQLQWLSPKKKVI